MNPPLLSLLVIVALVTGTDRAYSAEEDLAVIKSETTKRHDEAVKRLQDWIAQVSIAAENRGYPEGAEYMAKLARDAGFQQATVIEAVRFGGVDVAADGSTTRGQTAAGQSDYRSRRGEPEGTGSGVPWRRCMRFAAQARSCR